MSRAPGESTAGAAERVMAQVAEARRRSARRRGLSREDAYADQIAGLDAAELDAARRLLRRGGLLPDWADQVMLGRLRELEARNARARPRS